MSRTTTRDARSRAQLASDLARFSLAGGVKTATLGGDPEASFEQAFAALAYAYTKDKAPRLLDYMVGFQLVDRNEDNTKAAGIFGFKLGNQWVYAPVFFLNGDLKGHELLYLKGKDTFIPMKENWVNYLLSKRPHVLGEAISQQPQRLGMGQPDYRALSLPPQNAKYGSASPTIPDWLADFLPVLGSLTRDDPASLPKFASLRTFTLPEVLKHDLELVKVAMRCCELYPPLGRYLEQFHGPNLFRDALLHLREKTARDNSILTDMLPEPEEFTGLLETAPRRKVAVEITVKDDQTTTENGPQLSEEKAEKLLQDGYLIEDHREGEEVSIAYNTQIETRLSTPAETGLYEVLVRERGYDRCLIINHPHSNKGREEFVTVVRLGEDGKAWVNTDRSVVFSRKVEDSEQFSDWIEQQASPDSLEMDATYVAVSRNGQGSVPFTVQKKNGDDSYIVRFHAWPNVTRPIAMPALARPSRHLEPCEPCFYDSESLIVINKREGSRFKSVRGHLYVPAECRFIKISGPKKDEKYPDIVSDERSADLPMELGNLADLQLEILQKTARLKIYSNGNEIAINNGPLTAKMAAMFSLVRDHGFREADAKLLIKLAEQRGAATFRVKYAQPPFLTGGGPTAPAIPPPQMSYDGGFGGVQTQQPQSELMQVPELSAANTDPAVWDSMETPPDPMAMQAAQQAGQAGQKEVLDTTMIAAMLKTVRQDTMVDRFLGDLLKALDRLGRILFSFYWHQEEFMDRYGKKDIVELEDTLRNSFEVLGDLILFMKEKSVEPYPGAEVGGPEIDESARN